MFWPCETRTSICRNLATISSGLYRFLAITVLLDVKDIPQVGPLQWGRITDASNPTIGTLILARRWPSRLVATAGKQEVLFPSLGWPALFQKPPPSPLGNTPHFLSW